MSIAIKSTTASVPSTPSAPAAIVPLPTRMVLSSLAGMGAASVCHPLDVIRVHMQTSHYQNTYQAAKQIYRGHGFWNGLYAGISAAYLRQWLYGSCRIGIYSYLLERAKLSSGNEIPFWKKLSMGCVSGGIGSLVGTPAEVALVRMSADSLLPPLERRNYKHSIDCVARIIREEGVETLWRGATPTVARATVLSAFQLGMTSQVKEALIKSGKFGEKGQVGYGIPVMFVSSLMSSFVAVGVSNPFDVLKSRIQHSPSGQVSMTTCLVDSVKKDGILVLWRGFTPSWIKLAPYMVICFTLADKLTKAVTGKEAL